MKLTDYYDEVSRSRTENYQKSGALADTLVHRPNERHLQRNVQRAIGGTSSVADLGCGFGKYLLDGSLDRTKRVFLNDISGGMLRALQSRLEEKYPRLVTTTFAGSMLDIPLDSAGTYELAMCLGVINHLDDEQLQALLGVMATLAEKRILLYYAHEAFLLAKRVGVMFRKRGIHYQQHRRDVVRRSLEGAGFRQVRSSYAQGLPWLSPLVIQEFHRGQE